MTVSAIITPRATKLSSRVTHFHNRYAATCTILMFIGAALLMTGVVNPVGNQYNTHITIWGIYSMIALWVTFWIICWLNKARPASLARCWVPTLITLSLVILVSPMVWGY